MRLIDADAAVELLQSLGARDYRREKGTIMDAVKMLRHDEYTPTVDAVPVVHGYWKKSKDRTFMSPCYECSNCGRKINTFENPCKSAPYCHCGAKMDEENE